MNNIIKIRKEAILVYITLLAFLFPRGFAEYIPWYHLMQRYFLLVVTIILFFYFLIVIVKNKSFLNECTLIVCGYHITLLVITLYIQGGIQEGIQKVFFPPILFIFCTLQIKKNRKLFFNAFSNILIAELFLNITIFNEKIFPQYFLISGHQTFLGHVQLVSQIGILSIMIGEIIRLKERRKSNILIILGIANMLYSRTVVSYISLVILVMGIFIINNKKSNAFQNPLKYFIVPQLVSIGLIGITVALKGGYFINNMDVSMSGRMFIWKAILEKLKNHWFFGYGVYGTNFRVFWNAWTDNSGSNYAHNQILQLLLDGGVILLLVYSLMMYLCIKKMKKMNSSKQKKVAILVLCIFSIISIVESVGEYYFYFCFLAIVTTSSIGGTDELLIERRNDNASEKIF